MTNALHKEILELISEYLAKNPQQRFGQALFNLSINQIEENNNENFKLRDIYGDKDFEILERIKRRIDLINSQKMNDEKSN